MQLKIEVSSARSVFVFILFFIGGLWFIAGLVPPVSPSDTPETIAAFYRENQLRIQIGLMLAMFSVSFIVPMASALARQLKRIENSNHILANAQFGCGIVTTAIVTLAVILWSAASFRPERPEEITYLLNDLAWIGFTMPVSAIVVWMLCVGSAVLSDKSKDPIFPRWAGYFSLFCSALTIPGFPVVLFKAGPFAWNGLFAFWIALIVAIAWMILFAQLTVNAAKKEQLS